MRSRALLLAVIAVALGGYAAVNWQETTTQRVQVAKKSETVTAEKVAPLPPPQPAEVASPLPPPGGASSEAVPNVAEAPKTREVAPAPQSAPKPKSATPSKGSKKSPLSPYAMTAREALNYVGMDPDAELFWAQAINDPTLPADTRQDLIEDLNENGFGDPKNLTAADLPLIESRLDLIEFLAPFAMDETNLDAFAEAYKDLMNMQAKLTKPGG